MQKIHPLSAVLGAALQQAELLDKVVTRLAPMAKRANVETSPDYWLQLLSAVPIDLEALYTAPDKDFAADVFGIRNYFDPKAKRFHTDWRPACGLPMN